MSTTIRRAARKQLGTRMPAAIPAHALVDNQNIPKSMCPTHEISHFLIVTFRFSQHYQEHAVQTTRIHWKPPHLGFAERGRTAGRALWQKFWHQMRGRKWKSTPVN